MSYSRWSKYDCDIYCFPYEMEDKTMVIECCGCSLITGEYVWFKTATEFIEHLKLHIKKGDRVPEHLLKVETYKDYFDH
jgi:hypothetical protein